MRNDTKLGVEPSPGLDVGLHVMIDVSKQRKIAARIDDRVRL